MDVLLVPIDHTSCAWEVADTAARLATSLEARAVLLHVVQLPAGVVAAADISAVSGEQAMVALDRDANAHLSDLARVFDDAGVPTHSLLRHGPVAAAILRAAEQEDASMIVMGTHGRKGMARFVLGSVAEHVIRRADVPVLTVRTLEQPKAKAGEPQTTA